MTRVNWPRSAPRPRPCWPLNPAISLSTYSRPNAESPDGHSVSNFRQTSPPPRSPDGEPEESQVPCKETPDPSLHR